MRIKVAFDGGADLLKALQQMKPSLHRPILRRAATKSLEPFLAEVKRLAPVSDEHGGALRDSYVIGTKLTAREAPKARRQKETQVEVHAGTSNPAGLLQEFGTVNASAQPHMRPAWNAQKNAILDRFAGDLRTEIDKTARRVAKKEAKAAAKAAAGG